MKNDVDNPWLGLAAYQEEELAKGILFCGRKEATSDLARLIESSLCVTLYGRTGIGKTSLLNAGVFPVLRTKGFIPVEVRLGRMEEAKTEPFAHCITIRIEQEMSKMGGRVECYKVEKPLTPDNPDYLWEYFATRHFYDKENREVIPVVVLDQFEENFVSNVARTNLLLRQLDSLIDDNKIFPEGYHRETNFRIVISIREDDLYRLEDALDKNDIIELKSSRFRLRQLSLEEAKEVILIPGKESDCLDQNPEEVAKEIIKVVKGKNNDEINTLVLSLLCSQLYTAARKRNEKISVNLVNELDKNDPLLEFYKDLKKKSKLNEKEIYFIENSLVDSTKRRQCVSYDLINKNFKRWEEFTSGDNRILQKTNSGVELVHDLLATTIDNNRTQKRLSERANFLLALVLALVCVLFVGSYYSQEYADFKLFSSSYSEELTTKEEKISQAGVKKITVYGPSAQLTNCYDLKEIIVKPTTHVLKIENCPELVKITFLSDTIAKFSIKDCNRIKYLHLPKADEITIDPNMKLMGVFFNSPNNKFIWKDGLLWSFSGKQYIEPWKIIYAHPDKESAKFPYEMRKHTEGMYYYDISSSKRDSKKISNSSEWYKDIEFSKGKYAVVGSHDFQDSILDLTRFDSLIYVDKFSFYGNHNIKKVYYDRNIFTNTIEFTAFIPSKPLIVNRETGEILYNTKDSIDCRIKIRNGKRFFLQKPKDKIIEYILPENPDFRTFEDIPYNIKVDSLMFLSYVNKGSIYFPYLRPERSIGIWLPDTVINNINLEVPYGSIYNYLNLASFQIFKNSKERTQLQTIIVLNKYRLECGIEFIKDKWYGALFFILFAIAVLYALYVINNSIVHESHITNLQEFTILYTLLYGFLIFASWFASYWIIYDLIHNLSISSAWKCIIAGVFGLAISVALIVIIIFFRLQVNEIKVSNLKAKLKDSVHGHMEWLKSIPRQRILIFITVISFMAIAVGVSWHFHNQNAMNKANKLRIIDEAICLIETNKVEKQKLGFLLLNEVVKSPKDLSDPIFERVDSILRNTSKIRYLDGYWRGNRNDKIRYHQNDEKDEIYILDIKNLQIDTISHSGGHWLGYYAALNDSIITWEVGSRNPILYVYDRNNKKISDFKISKNIEIIDVLDKENKIFLLTDEKGEDYNLFKYSFDKNGLILEDSLQIEFLLKGNVKFLNEKQAIGYIPINGKDMVGLLNLENNGEFIPLGEGWRFYLSPDNSKVAIKTSKGAIVKSLTSNDSCKIELDDKLTIQSIKFHPKDLMTINMWDHMYIYNIKTGSRVDSLHIPELSSSYSGSESLADYPEKVTFYGPFYYEYIINKENLTNEYLYQKLKSITDGYTLTDDEREIYGL